MPSDPTPDEGTTVLVLDDYTRGLLQGLVRDGIRHAAKGAANLRNRFGSQYDSSRNDRRREALEDLYRQLGKEPSNITNVREGTP